MPKSPVPKAPEPTVFELPCYASRQERVAAVKRIQRGHDMQPQWEEAVDAAFKTVDRLGGACEFRAPKERLVYASSTPNDVPDPHIPNGFGYRDKNAEAFVAELVRDIHLRRKFREDAEYSKLMDALEDMVGPGAPSHEFEWALAHALHAEARVPYPRKRPATLADLRD